MHISGLIQPGLLSFVYEAIDTAWETVPDGVWHPGSINQLRNHWAEIQTVTRLGLPLFLAKAHTDPARVQIDSVGDAGNQFVGSSFLLRCDVRNVLPFTESLTAQGGLPIVSAQEYLELAQWPDRVDPAFTKRSVARATLEDIWDFATDRVNQEFVAPYSRDGRFFVKTEKKGEAWMVGDGVEFPGMLYSMACRFSPRTRLIISSPLDLVTDSQGEKLEYRCFVAENNLLSISVNHYVQNEAVPAEIKAFAREFMAAHFGVWPRQYVVDIATDKELGPVVVELNALAASGRYAGNDVESLILAYFPDIDPTLLAAVRAQVAAEMRLLEEQRSRLVPVDREAEIMRRLDELLGRPTSQTSRR